MADELKIKVTVDGKAEIKDLSEDFVNLKKKTDDAKAASKALKDEAKDFREGIKEWRNALRLLELEFKKGNISIGEFEKGSIPLMKALKQFEDGSGRTAAAQQALWHANNRVTIGFKSLASEVSGIHNKMRPASDQFREFYREQRVGDRTMREAGGAIRSVTGLLGVSGLGGAANTAFNSFQEMEFAVKGSSIALESMGGIAPKIGSALNALALPLAITGAGILLISENSRQMEERLKKADKAILDLKLSLGDITKSQYLKTIKDELSSLDGEADKIKRKADIWASLGFKLIPSLFGISDADAKEMEIRFLKLREEIKKLTGEADNLATSPSHSPVTMKAVLGYEKSITKEVKERVDSEKEYKALLNDVMDMRVKAARTFSKKGMSQLQGVKEESAPKIEVEFSKAEQAMMSFEGMAQSSIMRVGSTIGNSIGGALTDTFLGIGHTVVGQFINDLVSQLAQSAIFSILSMIFNFGTGGVGSIVGSFAGAAAGGGIVTEPMLAFAPKSRTFNIIGERGPEYLLNQKQMGSLLNPKRSSGSSPTIVINGNFAYDRLAFAVQQGDRVLSKRTF